MANGVRLRALREILDAFEVHRIEARVLKGPALISLVYTDPALRPTSDLDVLVPKQEALRAQRLLIEIGYGTSSVGRRTSLARHHHLPIATRWIEGVRVQVEVHHDALSRDYKASLALDQDREPPTTIDLAGRPALSLGPHEMLWHLCQHLVGPLPRPLRLIWTADIVGFAEAFSERLDWEYTMRRRSIIANVLALVHGVTPLPVTVFRHIPTRTLDGLRNVGADDRVWAWTPGGRSPGESRLQQVSRVLSPPVWWLDLRYGRSGRSMGLCVQRLRHLGAAGRAFRRRGQRLVDG
jgi:hypothetical protein